MSNIVIRVENIGKRYRIGQYIGGMYQYRALRDVLTDAMYAPFRRLRARSKRQGVGSNPTSMSWELTPNTRHLSSSFIWALKDVSFEVKQGEVVGIIGRNGAGKSTLLKVLSRITEPTEGRAEIKGCVRSLLEVGTGFHSELTGWENIYLSGAILGMTKKEIDRKFDEIVAFAELEKFMDTPVKRYSSGMLVRLGFAVAAHLEPEILLVDEVLAVGDVAFQKKCLGKMGDVAKEGRTVLFVSHNMAAVANFCPCTIVLNSGHVEYIGNTNDAIQHYLEIVNSGSGISLTDRTDRLGNGKLRLTNILYRNSKGDEVAVFRTGDDGVIELVYESPAQKPPRNVRVGLALDTATGQRVTLLQNEMSGYLFGEIPPAGIIRCHIPQIPLAAGRYYFSACVMVNGIIADWITQATTMDIEGSDFFNTGHYPNVQDGIILIPQKWSAHSRIEMPR